MSVKIMSWAWSQKLEPTKKLILMALADYADDDGVCWPSMNRLADKCNVSRRTILRNINVLKDDGILSSSHRHREDGSMSSSRYVIHAETQCDTLRQNVTPPCDTGVTPPATPVSHHEPSLESPFRKERGRAGRIPENWLPSPDNILFAINEGFQENQVGRIADKFKDYWTAASGRNAAKKDWDATWRNWVRREAERVSVKKPERMGTMEAAQSILEDMRA